MDLIEPRSAISGSTELEFRSNRHLFFLQSKLADELSAWIDTKDDWPVPCQLDRPKVATGGPVRSGHHA
jgi:methionyl-tRNA synthetase